MRVTWTGVVGMALLISTVFAGGGLYLWKDRLVLSPIVVTVEAIPDCSPIPASSLKIIRLPRMGIPPGTAQALEDVNKLWTNCGYFIPKNSFLYMSHLSTGERKAAGAEREGPDARRITIPIDNAVNIGIGLNKGDRIDVWFVTNRQPKGSFVGKLFDDIEVLEVTGNNENVNPPADGPDRKKGLLSFSPMGTSPAQTLLTISLKEEDIPFFLSAQEEGKLVWVGRGRTMGERSGRPLHAKAWLEFRWEKKGGAP